MVSRTFFVIVLLALVSLPYSSHALGGRYCRRVRPYSCERPPVDKVDLKRYLGTWYSLYNNANALRVAGGRCVTARYRKGPNNIIKVLNCGTLRGSSRPRCVRGKAFKRTPAGSDSRLRVQFGPFPPGSYNIAALLGDKEYGYYAAAVYGCSVFKGRTFASWFILGRSPFMADVALRKLKWRLFCKGYPVYREKFFRTAQGRGCTYFFSGKGFDVFKPSRPSFAN